MRKIFHYLIFLTSLLFFFASCSVTGINLNRKTPKKQKKYPEFTRQDSLKGYLSPQRSCFDVSYYDIRLRVIPDEKKLEGKVSMQFTAIEKSSEIQIDLYKQFQISSITINDSTANYSREKNAVFIKLAHELQPGDKYTLDILYSGEPVIAKKPPWEGGFVWSKDKNNNPYIGVSCETEGASLWWPVKDHLSDEPDSALIQVIVPENLYCVSNGILTRQKEIPESHEKKFQWKVSYPINTYNITIYVGDYKHFSVPYKSDSSQFNMDFYTLPYHFELAKEHFKQTKDIISFYEKKFGAYPFPKDGFKLVESPYEGMEHQTAIAYGDKYKNQASLGFDYIILHEAAHEWWGNALSVQDFSDIWLHEGFATYSEALYVEHEHNYEMYLKYLNLYSVFIKNERPVVGPEHVNFWEYKDTDVYLKGALILHTLRNILNNDTLFFNILQEFYAKYKYKIVKTQDFIHLVNEKTGEDYFWFFNQYLYSRVCPSFEWSFDKNYKTGDTVLYYRWDNMKNDMKLPVTILTNLGEKIQLFPSNELQAYYFNPEVLSIELNPKNSYIALNQNDRLPKLFKRRK